MKLKPFIQYSLLSLLALLLIVVAIISWLIATQSGLRFIVNTGLKYVPELNIEQINGRIIGPLSITNLQYKNQEIDVNLNKAELNWQPSELLLSAVIVNYLTVSGINIKQIAEPTPSPKENKPSPTLEDIIQQLQLPVTITVEKIDIQSLAYDSNFYKNQEAEDKSKPITIDQLLLSIQSDSQKIKLDTIKFDSNIVKLDGNLKIGLAKKENTNGYIEWELIQESIKSVKGITRLSGNTQQLAINNDIAAPYSSEIGIIIDNLIKSPSATADLKLKKINTNNINSEWPNYTFDGNIGLEGDIDNTTFNSTIVIENKQATSKPFKTINIDTQGKWANEQLIFTVNSNAPSIVELLTLEGIVKPNLLQKTSSTDAIELNLAWQDYNKPDPVAKSDKASNNLYSPEGKIKFTGNINQYIFDLAALFETTTKNKQSGELLINGDGSQEALSFEQIKLTGPIGTLDGEGKILIKPAFSADIELSGKKLNPGILSTQWPGQLDLDLAVKTETDDTTTIINSNITSSGTLRSYPFNLNAKGSFSEDKIQLNKLDLKSGGSTLTASAEVKNKKQLFANWALNSKKLQELIPNTQGTLRSKGDIAFIPIEMNSSTTITPTAVIELKASDVVIAHNQFEHIDALVDLDWHSEDSKKNNRINIKADNITIDDMTIASTLLQFEGKPEDHKISGDIDSNKGDIAFAFSGQAFDIQTQPRWLFSLDKATLSPNDIAPWQLNESVKGSVNSTKQTINEHCWSAVVSQTQTSQLCFGATHNNQELDANFNIKQLHTEYLTPLLPDGLSWVNTVISGKGKLAIPASGKLNSTIHLTTSPGQLNWTQQTANTEQQEKAKEKNSNSALTTQSIHFDAGELSVNSINDSLNANITLPLEQQTGIKGKLNIEGKAGVTFVDRPMKGQLSLNLNDLAPLVSFIPDASDLEGELYSQWKIGGTIQTPWLDGELALKNGQMRLNTPGVFLENIALDLQGNRQNGFSYTLNAQSGEGSLNTKGNVKLNEQGPEINLTVKGKDFQVFNTEEAIVYASPDLKVSSKKQTVSINGSVTIPKAAITPKKIPESVVTVSEDQIIVDQNNQATTSKVQQHVSANIDLILGDDVQVDGFGFKGKTTGTLQINKEKQGPTLGNGKIRIIDGEYRAFGQGLVIEKGLVIFSNGPINKPGIDIKALRRPAEGITVGVFARGSLTQPNLTIFSEPGMTQTEQLSWLILGRPPEQSSEGENNAINQLLLSLTLSQGDSILNSLSDTFNLDTLSIKTGSGEAGAASDNDLAELVLGKYLSPDLYVSYGIGLFKPVNVLSLEYSLGKHWKLTSETSSEASGGDVVYTIER